jgi:uncharacterized protein (TIGR02421 family)
MQLDESEKQDIREACAAVYEASRSIRVLTHLAWPDSVRKEFFQKRAKELPRVEYPSVDSAAVIARMREIRARLNLPDFVSRWLLSTVDDFETSARMLDECGHPVFFELSARLYGSPTQPLVDSGKSPLDLALQFDGLFEECADLDLGAPPDARVDAENVAIEMRQAVARMFADDAPEIVLVDELSANALAGTQQIRIRRGAMFTDRDVYQLIHHEAGIHVGTSLNGLNQTQLPILAAAHPGTTTTQEGLAVFAEFITGSIDLDRFRRLADRVIAIQMAIDGADFLQVYHYFLNRTDDKEQSFENARRVFRGGVMSGGAPFTKDIVYLHGLLRVHNFLRAMVGAGRADCLRLLFCGKLDIEDLPVLAELSAAGLCQPPKYLPAWATDIRFLLCYLAYSLFLNKIDLGQVRAHYQGMLQAMPRVSA